MARSTSEAATSSEITQDRLTTDAPNSEETYAVCTWQWSSDTCIIRCHSMAGTGLITAPKENALPGFTLQAGIIRRPRHVATLPWERAWRH